jgi:hypothetical protein
VRLREAGVRPVPLRVTDLEATFAVVDAAVSKAWRPPAADGVKETVAVQVAPAASVWAQVVEDTA